MSPIIEITLQIFLLALAVWLIRRACIANKRAKPHNLRDFQAPVSSKELGDRLDAMFIAGGFVVGLGIIAFVVLKLFDCGIVCGPEWW